jgi:hypothetical protein
VDGAVCNESSGCHGPDVASLIFAKKLAGEETNRQKEMRF